MDSLQGLTEVEKSPPLMPRSSQITITIRASKAGSFSLSLNAEAMRQLGKPRKVRLLFNAQTQQVAILPGDTANPDHYSINSSGSIACHAFLRERRAWAGKVGGTVQDGALVFSLPYQSDSRPRSRVTEGQK